MNTEAALEWFDLNKVNKSVAREEKPKRSQAELGKCSLSLPRQVGRAFASRALGLHLLGWEQTE